MTRMDKLKIKLLLKECTQNLAMYNPCLKYIPVILVAMNLFHTHFKLL